MGLSGNLNFGQAAQDEGKDGFSTPGASQSNHSGNAENRTQATIGNNVDITIKDEANQTQDIATLNRDTDNAHQSLDNIFDKDKEQERLDEQKLISDIGNQLSNIVRTEGQIRAENAKNDKASLEQAERELLAEGKNPTEQEIKQRAENNAMRDWGVGGKYQQITQAITGALQGAFNGDLTQALANGSAPFLAEAIKNATTNPDGSVNTEANLAAHAILGALLSQANGNSALAGGLGALTAEAAANLIKNELYGDKSFADLTDAERQNISTLAQIAAAVAGGLAGDSSSDAAQGAIAGKNAVEFNRLLNKNEQQILSNLINEGHDPHKLEAAACALTKCYAQFPIGSDDYEKFYALAKEGEQYSTEQNLLKNGELTITLTIDPLYWNKVPEEVQRQYKGFEYSQQDQIADGIASTEAWKIQYIADQLGVDPSLVVLTQTGVNLIGQGASIYFAGQVLKPGGVMQDDKANNSILAKLTPEMESKILLGQRIENSNKIIGGHSPSINDTNPKYAVETIKVNADGTRTVKYTTQFEDGNLSKIKTSTLFPESWSDKKIIDSINKIGNTSPIGQRPATGETLHRGTVNGVEIDVIKNGNVITAGYPVGGKPTPGFSLLK